MKYKFGFMVFKHPLKKIVWALCSHSRTLSSGESSSSSEWVCGSSDAAFLTD